MSFGNSNLNFFVFSRNLRLIVLQVLAKKVTSDQLSFLINGLIEALSDGQSHSSSGACVVLNSLLRIRGAELGGEVKNIIIICVCMYVASLEGENS